MLISHSYRVIFVHIQRTGGNSIRRVFNEMDSNAIQQLPIPTNKNRLKHCFLSDIQTALDSEIFSTYTKFAVVRNPFDRLFSWYSMFKNKTIAKSELAGGVERTATLGNAVEAAIEPYLDTFETFLNVPNEDLFTRFYDNQFDYVQLDGKLAVDEILRFENLNADFNVLAEKLNFPAKLPIVNQSIRQSDYRHAYNATTQKMVTERFARDLEHFSYSFSDSL